MSSASLKTGIPTARDAIGVIGRVAPGDLTRTLNPASGFTSTLTGTSWEKRAEEIGLNLRASVQGKYLVLLHVIKAPDDEKTYGAFYDYGFSEEYSYAGFDNLTPGYWVYMAPYWYVWAATSDNVGGT